MHGSLVNPHAYPALTSWNLLFASAGSREVSWLRLPNKRIKEILYSLCGAQFRQCNIPLDELLDLLPMLSHELSLNLPTLLHAFQGPHMPF